MVFAKVLHLLKKLGSHEETYDFSSNIPKEDRWAYYWLAAITAYKKGYK